MTQRAGSRPAPVATASPTRDRPLRHRLALDLLAARTLQRARDARAHPEVVVRRVRDRVDVERRDVAVDDLELHSGSLPLSDPISNGVATPA